jgi:hypothetical protein
MMKCGTHSCDREVRIARALICAVAFQLFLGTAHAQTDTMNSGNSSASVNYTVDNQQGFYNWTVDGVNQMNQQSFWYEIGGSGPAANIGSSPTSVSTTTTGNTLDVTYNYSQFSFSELYTLEGGTSGSGVSDVAETITINNTSSSALNFNLFQYTDINLLNTPNGQIVTLYQGGPRSLFNEAYQTAGNLAFVDSVNTPGANYGEAAPVNTLLNLLNGSSFQHLNDNTTIGPTDAAYALEWDSSINAGGSQIISEDLNVYAIPEPSSWTLVSAGLITLVVFRWYAGKLKNSMQSVRIVRA